MAFISEYSVVETSGNYFQTNRLSLWLEDLDLEFRSYSLFPLWHGGDFYHWSLLLYNFCFPNLTFTKEIKLGVKMFALGTMLCFCLQLLAHVQLESSTVDSRWWVCATYVGWIPTFSLHLPRSSAVVDIWEVKQQVCVLSLILENSTTLSVPPSELKRPIIKEACVLNDKSMCHGSYPCGKSLLCLLCVLHWVIQGLVELMNTLGSALTTHFPLLPASSISSVPDSELSALPSFLYITI